VIEVLTRLRENEVDIVTIGQYLQPKREKLDVVEYVHPDVFEEYREIGEGLGFGAVFSGPFVRSSYMADLVAHQAAQV
jgi:lipoic acid synthetase